MNLKLLPLLSILTLPTIHALVLPNPPYAISLKSSPPSTTHAIDITLNTPDPHHTQPLTNKHKNNSAPEMAIPIPPSEYDLERMSLPALKATLRTCDVVFAVVALVLLVPGLVVVLVRGWNYCVHSEESSEPGDRLEGEGLLGRDRMDGGYAKGGGSGSVMNQIGNGGEIVRNDGWMGERKMAVFTEEEEV